MGASKGPEHKIRYFYFAGLLMKGLTSADWKQEELAKKKTN